MDRGAWQATIHRVTESQTWPEWLSTHMHTHMRRKASQGKGSLWARTRIQGPCSGYLIKHASLKLSWASTLGRFYFLLPWPNPSPSACWASSDNSESRDSSPQSQYGLEMLSLCLCLPTISCNPTDQVYFRQPLCTEGGDFSSSFFAATNHPQIFCFHFSLKGPKGPNTDASLPT